MTWHLIAGDSVTLENKNITFRATRAMQIANAAHLMEIIETCTRQDTITWTPARLTLILRWQRPWFEYKPGFETTETIYMEKPR